MYTESPGEPNGPEQDPKILIERLKQNFEQWMKEDPETAQKVKDNLLAYSYDESELPEYDMSIVKIGLEDLNGFGTGCGTVGNKSFTPEVVDFLKQNGADLIIALSQNDKKELSLAMINLKDHGEVLESMIAKNDGSFRADNASIDGWTWFESE